MVDEQSLGLTLQLKQNKALQDKLFYQQRESQKLLGEFRKSLALKEQRIT